MDTQTDDALFYNRLGWGKYFRQTLGSFAGRCVIMTEKQFHVGIVQLYKQS